MLRPSNDTPNNRLSYLDSIRALLMLLGIPYHAALIYHSEITWMGIDGADSIIFTYFSNLIHSFRMPVFFIISGYLSLLILKKSAADHWLYQRILRLGIPFITCLVLFGPLQIYLEKVATSITYHSADKTFIEAPSFSISLYDNWVFHLWFLLQLLFFCLLLSFLWKIRDKKIIKKPASVISHFCGEHPLLSLVIAVFFIGIYSGTVAVIADLLPYVNIPFKLFSLQHVLTMLPYFFFGVLLHCKGWMEFITRISVPLWVIGLAAAIIVSGLPTDLGLIAKVIRKILEAASGILIAHVLLSMTHRWFNKSSPFLRKAVDSSYTIYLVHHPIIVVLGILAVYLDIPSSIAFVLIIAITLYMGIKTHAAICSHRFLRVLLNGETRSKNLYANPIIN